MFQLVANIHLWDIGSLDCEKQQGHAPWSILRMSVDGMSTIFAFASWVNHVLIGCRHQFFRHWQRLLAETTATCSLPHPGNERQQSVNDCWPSIMVHHSAMWPLLSIYMDITVLVCSKSHQYLVVAQWMNCLVTALEDVAGLFHTDQPIKAAISLCLDACNQVRLILPRMPDPELLTFQCRSFSTWGREHFTFSFYCKGGQYSVYDCILPVAPPDYPRYTTNNSWRSLSRWGSASVSCSFGHHRNQYIGNALWYTNDNISPLVLACLNTTINVTPKLQNSRLETMGLPKPGVTRGVTGPGPGLSHQESAGDVFG